MRRGRGATYQGNVFGLATAFINQGVAAYIAPLWPIDDMLAQHIALEFYRQLLCERTTLGEALRRAKASARRSRTPSSASRRDGHEAWAGLGWASLVLYGDPTEELFQALAGGPADEQRARSARQPDAASAARRRPQPAPRRGPLRQSLASRGACCMRRIMSSRSGCRGRLDRAQPVSAAPATPLATTRSASS